MTDDHQHVQHILLHRKDYYKVLRVEKHATVEEVKRAYKKSALLCHPDKNKHPKASEAFQVVGAAFQTLGDAQKRAVYDRHGVEGVQQHESGGAAGGHGARGGYYQQHQYQHPFEEFFFNLHRAGGPPRRPGAAGGRQQQQHHDGEGNFQEVPLNLLMLAPVLLFILIAMMLQSGVNETDNRGFGANNRNGKNFIYSFSLVPNADEGMTVQRVTNHPQYREFAVKYYVSRQWHDMANRGYIDFRKTEVEVLKKHRDSLGRRCESEILRQRSKGRVESSPDVCIEHETLRSRIRS